jgi:ATP-dependent helicase/nuclease subunit A
MKWHEGPSYAKGLEEATRRERAERQRLAYVAATRASHAMIFVGDRAPPQAGISEAYSATTAAALRAIAETPEALARARLAIEDALPTVLPVDVARDLCAPREAAEFVPIDRAPWRVLPIAVTALQDFHHCARRFQLAQVLDLPERAPPFVEAVVRDEPEELRSAPRLDARAEGTLAHRVLEQVDAASFGSRLLARAEAARVLTRAGIGPEHEKHGMILDRVLRFLDGAYAGRIAEKRGAIAREVAFVLEVKDPEGRAVALRGAIDLLVRWRDGTIDVLDYKRARGPSPEPHGFQLDAYVLAARALVPEATRVRSGIVFLGSADPAAEPAWRPVGDPGAIRARLAALGARLVEARWSERFPREPIATCRAIRCGYAAHCHPEDAP